MPIFSVDSNIPMLIPILEKVGTVYSFANGEITNEQLITNKTEFLIVRSTIKVNENLLKGTNVKFVGTVTTGVEHIALDYLQKNGIKFASAAGSNSNSVAEYVIYSILLWFHQTVQIDNNNIGIIGFGNIGTKVAKYLENMQLEYCVNDPIVKKDKNIKRNYQNLNFVSLDKIIKNCNVITTHVPLTTEGKYKTLNLLDAKRIKQIKPNSLIICTSRGGVCDEKAMLARKDDLNFIVDVWENEPYVNNRELIDISLLATPHIAGHSFHGKLKGTLMIAAILNEIYNFNLDLSEIFSIIKERKLLNPNDIQDFNKLFNSLTEERKLMETSLKMKEKSNLSAEEFKNYFEFERANYPKLSEILYLD